MVLTNVQRAALNSAESCLVRDLDQIPASGVIALKMLFDASQKFPKAFKGPLKAQITELVNKYDHSNYSKVPAGPYREMVARCVAAKTVGMKDVPGTKVPFQDWTVFFTSFIFAKEQKALRETLIPEVKEEENYTASAAEYSCRAISDAEDNKELGKRLNDAYKAWLKV